MPGREKIAEAYVEVSADTAKLQRGLDRSLTRTKAFTARASSELKNFGRAVGKASIAVTALSGTMLALVNSYTKAGDKFAKTSKALGVGTETLSALSFAADRSGASFANVEVGLRTLAKRANDFTRGLSTSVDTFEALGVSVSDAGGRLKPIEQLFLEVAESLRGMESETERVALAQELFGRSGTALIPLMLEGKEGITALMNEARALGLTYDDLAGKRSEAFQDAMTNAKGALKGVKNAIAEELTPHLTSLLDKFADMKKTGELKPIIDGLADTFKTAASGAILLGGAIVEVVRGIRMLLKTAELAAIEASKMAARGGTAAARAAGGGLEFDVDPDEALLKERQETESKFVRAANERAARVTQELADLAARENSLTKSMELVNALWEEKGPAAGGGAEKAQASAAEAGEKVAGSFNNALLSTFKLGAEPTDFVDQFMAQMGEARFEPQLQFDSETFMAQLDFEEALSGANEFLGQMDERLLNMSGSAATLGEALNESIQTDLIQDFVWMTDQALMGFSNVLGGIVTGTADAGEAIKSLGQSIIQMIINWMVQRGVASILGKSLQAAETVASTTAAAVTASAWAPAAAMVSLASFGANAPAAQAGIATTVGLSSSLSKIPGFAEGGLIRSPTLATFAEKGPELAIPLDRFMRDFGGGRSPVVNIHIGEVRTSQDEEELLPALDDVMRRSLSR